MVLYVPKWWTRMMTSSNGNIFRVTGPLCGEFTGPGEFPTQRPVTRSFDVFFDLRLNIRLSKQPRGWWFETLSWSLWRHRNGSLFVVIFCGFLFAHLPIPSPMSPGVTSLRWEEPCDCPSASEATLRIWLNTSIINLQDLRYRWVSAKKT